jgi:hypothetical protein
MINIQRYFSDLNLYLPVAVINFYENVSFVYIPQSYSEMQNILYLSAFEKQFKK